AIAPVLPQIIRIEGALDPAVRPVTNVVFEGITFSHAEWYFPESFYTAKEKPEVSPPPKPEVGGFAQAAIGVPGTVWAEGAQGCRFSHCAFGHSGGYGLELGRGCQSNQVLACEFKDLGGGGLKLGETAIRDKPAEQSFGNVISDCSLVDGGRLFHSAVDI